MSEASTRGVTFGSLAGQITLDADAFDVADAELAELWDPELGVGSTDCGLDVRGGRDLPQDGVSARNTDRHD